MTKLSFQCWENNIQKMICVVKYFLSLYETFEVPRSLGQAAVYIALQFAFGIIQKKNQKILSSSANKATAGWVVG